MKNVTQYRILELESGMVLSQWSLRFAQRCAPGGVLVDGTGSSTNHLINPSRPEIFISLLSWNIFLSLKYFSGRWDIFLSLKYFTFRWDIFVLTEIFFFHWDIPFPCWICWFIVLPLHRKELIMQVDSCKNFKYECICLNYDTSWSVI